ncbi:hypothetical protein [Actinoplanes sp. NPDC026619]|uniref:hypothetical protein n=1 Tax=Actinoplanes sp. NPDC026619 TaxID=3155798 RepID=UPI0033F4DDBE
MKIRAFLARLVCGDTAQAPTGDAHGTTRRAEAADQVEPRTAWRPTARSAYGRYLQASQHQQAAIEAISRRGDQIGADPRDVLAAYDRLDAGLRARGWHPDQFRDGWSSDEPWIDDFMDRTDVDYDPRMAAYDAQLRQRRDTDGDEA